MTVRSLLRLHDARRSPSAVSCRQGFPLVQVSAGEDQPPTLSGTMLHYCDVRVRNPQARKPR